MEGGDYMPREVIGRPADIGADVLPFRSTKTAYAEQTTCRGEQPVAAAGSAKEVTVRVATGADGLPLRPTQTAYAEQTTCRGEQQVPSMGRGKAVELRPGVPARPVARKAA